MPMIQQASACLTPVKTPPARFGLAYEGQYTPKNLLLAVCFLLLTLAIGGLLAPTASAQGYAGQFSWQNSNLNETILTPLNVNSTKFGKIFSFPVDGHIYAQPLYVPNVVIPEQGTHNVVYVVTENDSAYAFDADGLSSAPLWYVSFINPAQGITAIPCFSFTKVCNIYPTIGITGTPVIDPSTGTIYFDAHTDENGTFVHRLHALDITTGAEKFGGPVVIQASVKGKGMDSVGGFVPFDSQHTAQRPGLLLMNGVVYIPYGNYHGWVLGYNAQNLNQLYAFNTSPNSVNSNIWQSGQGLVADSLGNIYFATSDAKFDANNTSNQDYGDTLLKLNSSLQLVDYFTPMDQACRGGHDVDLGSGGPLILPTQTGPYPDEIIFGGKGGTPCDLWAGGIYAAPLYVINFDSMGQYNATQDQIPQEIQGAPFGYWSSPAYWQAPGANYVYAAGTQGNAALGDYLKQYTLTNGLLSTTPVASSTSVLPDGATPYISANVSTNGIVWAAERQQSLDLLPGTKPLLLLAYDATNVANLLYSSAQNSGRDTAGLAAKFPVPLVANGRVYVGTQTEVDVYGPLSASLSPTTLSWGIVPIGSTSQPKVTTLTNSGSSSIAISSITITGTNSSEFSISSKTCGSSLGAGASCTISVAFKPTAEGTQSATLSVVDGGGTQTAALSGSGTAVKFAPASLTFASQSIGTTSAPQTATMTNLGSTALTITSIAIGGSNPTDFAQTNTCGSSLAPGGSCGITVTFSPTVIGSRTANVTVTDSSLTSPQKLILSGTGTQSNVSFTVLPTSIAFNPVDVGMQGNCQPVNVTNTGTTSLTINSFTLTPFMVFELQYGYAPRTLSPGQFQTYCIKFVPQAAQVYAGQMSVSIAGVVNPSIVTFTGTGLTTGAIASVSPNTLTFGPQPLGTTTSQTVTVSNTGTQPFHLTSVTLQPPFNYTGYTSSVAVSPGKSFQFQVTFNPSQAITYTNTVSLGFDVLPAKSTSLVGSGTTPTTLAITSFPTLPPVTQNAAYLAPLTAAGGTGPLTWSLAAGSSLPAGLTLSPSTGAIAGTPAASVGLGTYTFTAQVADSSHVASAVLNTTVDPYNTGTQCNNITQDVAGTSNPIIPLNDLGTGTYLGFEGGLYPNGSNTAPPTQQAAALSRAQAIQPLDASGNPNPNGIYALLSIGVSITRTIWDQFEPAEAGDPAVNSHMVLVNAAIDGVDSPVWADPTSGAWLTIMNYYLPYQNVSPNQVVAAWVMMPHSHPLGFYPGDMADQESDLIAILQNLHVLFPNLAIAYISSNHYGGYSKNLSYPEPYSYEFGLAVQTVIADQINGQANLNYNPANGPVMAPLLMWGPYTWENGLTPRSDGLTWSCQDVTTDGLHPSAAGRNKEAGLLETFFKTDPTTTPWFLHP